MRIGIIGAGASGITAAIFAAQNTENQVTLMERQSRVGRKLAATGNGRCNLTNLHAGHCGYHGEQPDFPDFVLTQFGPEKTRAWFHSLGLLTVAEASGRVYPYSDQANSVVDILRFGLNRDNITLMTGFEVTKAGKNGSVFQVSAGGDSLCFDRLVIACGGLAGTKLGGSMSGYRLLRGFGHHATRLRPSLVQLCSSWHGLASLKGVRTNCLASILHDGTVTAVSQGELQFTEYGLSGPVIFEISRDACQTSGDWSCQMDFLPDMSTDELARALLRRRSMPICTEDLLTGILHNRLGRVLTKAVGIQEGRPLSSLQEEEAHAVAGAVKAFSVALTQPMGMNCAQVTAGGIQTTEFNRQTMESRIVPGLYACGEVLDVDGDCGGYNLQWAWSSGRAAGLCAGGIEK